MDQACMFLSGRRDDDQKQQSGEYFRVQGAFGALPVSSIPLLGSFSLPLRTAGTQGQLPVWLWRIWGMAKTLAYDRQNLV